MQNHRKELVSQIASFSLMIALTLIVFLGMWSGAIATKQFVPFILAVAVIQTFLQLFYLMHLKERGYSAVKFFLYSGVFFAFLILLGFVTIIWI